LTCGRDLEEALLNLERMEHVAEVFWRAHALHGGVGSVARPWQAAKADDPAGE
jgi:ribulose-5-phosphate 4-epimerase/fuculose-1-phosphate aldolase